VGGLKRYSILVQSDPEVIRIEQMGRLKNRSLLMKTTSSPTLNLVLIVMMEGRITLEIESVKRLVYWCIDDLFAATLPSPR